MSIRQSLESLYGHDIAVRVAKQVSAILAEWRPRLRQPGERERGGRNSLDLTQRDALLITYADQVTTTEGGEPPLRVLADFCARYLKDTVSGVHILPFYPWSSDDGFSVKDFYGVDQRYGGWEDIARFGGAGFELMFDGVFNHVSAQGEWFQRFLADDAAYRNFFVTVNGNPDLSQVVRPRTLPLLTDFETKAGKAVKVWTTFSADQVDLNFKNPEVLLQILETCLWYAAKGARFLRLDAIAFLWKEIGTSCLHLPQTHAVIRFLRAALDEAAPWVLLITETNVPHADNISYFGDGSNEAQLVYNFALPPLVLHSFATGSAARLTRWARTLALPSEQVTFFNFLASHDGIGVNPARGILSEEEIEQLVRRTLEHGGFISYKNMPDGRQVPYELNINYLDALSNPADNEPASVAARKLLSAHAVLYSLRGVPGIYFHSLFGSRGDRKGAESSGIPRRINREKLRGEALDAELSSAGSLRQKVFAGQCELLQVRRQHPAFAPGTPQQVLECDPRVFAVLLDGGPGHCVLCLHNVSAEPLLVELGDFLPCSGQWTRLWCSYGSKPRRVNTRSIVVDGWGTEWVSAV